MGDGALIEYRPNIHLASIESPSNAHKKAIEDILKMEMHRKSTNIIAKIYQTSFEAVGGKYIQQDYETRTCTIRMARSVFFEVRARDRWSIYWDLIYYRSSVPYSPAAPKLVVNARANQNVSKVT